MAIRELIPWTGPRSLLFGREGDGRSLFAIEERMARMFDDFLRDFGWEPAGLLPETASVYVPRVDVTDEKDHLVLTADLPGMEVKDIDLSLTGDSVTLRGERTYEKEKEGREYYRHERSWGTFHRTIPLPCEVDAGTVDATFKNGILTVKLPKTKAEVEGHKRIEIKSE